MKKILVVDDEKDVLFMLEKRLKAEGYSVITTTNGKNAIALAQSQRPDIIILDIVMPGMDGAEVAAALKEHLLTGSIPVIFLTGLLSKEEELQENHMIGSHITFAKPFDTEELLAQIKSLLCNVTTS